MTKSIENQLTKIQKSLGLNSPQVIGDEATTDAWFTIPNDHVGAREVYAQCMRHNDLRDTGYTCVSSLTVCFEDDMSEAYMAVNVLVIDTVLNRSNELSEGKEIYFNPNTPSIDKIALKAIKELESRSLANLL